MESTAHANLKRLAAAYLLTEGYRAVATEVRCPGSRYRVDVAGFLDRIPYPPDRDGHGETLWSTAPLRAKKRNSCACEPRTVIVECKQSRADFIRDDRKADELIALRDELRGWKQHVEEHRIKPREPELRRTDSALFAELEDWDFDQSRSRAYRRLLRRIRAVEKQLYGETKFSLMRRYRLADQLFIAVPRGLIRKREAPEGWGVLEFPRDLLEHPIDSAITPPQESRRPAWRITVTPEGRPSPQEQQARLLRNIAIAATREAFRR